MINLMYIAYESWNLVTGTCNVSLLRIGYTINTFLQTCYKQHMTFISILSILYKYDGLMCIAILLDFVPSAQHPLSKSERGY